MRTATDKDWIARQAATSIEPFDGKELEADTVVRSLRRALVSGSQSLANVPGLLARVLREGFWKSRIDEMSGRITHKAFIDFVTTQPPAGLGTTIERLRFVCRDDAEALDLMDRALQRPAGGDNNPHGCKGKPEPSGRINVTIGDIDSAETPPRPRGNGREAALRRLRKSRPDLHAQVIAGEKTAHAAMIEAGFRKVLSPLEQIRRLLPKLSPTDLSELRRILDDLNANGGHHE